ncbi:S49 family peptidase [Vibrio parahaemolyticus]|uniref:S49 family peptidase n=1 Tax=Vibrio parahaemolyticus TaxID=670 RepID=UPI001EEB6981|nr:S49 family peptidase [Vibrio parahaemolyticus]MCG6428417.1 S49 family peptidase [Vibrio parahaemolyticus]
MKHKFALNYLMSQPWALDQQLLSLMSDIANRDANSLTLEDFAPESLSGKSGKAITRGMEKREGGVAMIHVNGVISRYANLFTNICGGTTTQLLAQDFTQALNDPSIKAILLNIDSPGGEAKGIHELAEMIYQARGKKRIIAYVGGNACSAAYWIASACDEIVIDATGCAGSIGTVLEMRVRKQRDEDEFETIEIVSSQSPNKRQDPSTETGRAAYQKHLDDLAEVFVQRVARNMAVSRDTVINEFGGGGILIGQDAVDKGMAHRLGSLEGVIAELKTGKKATMDPKKEETGASDDNKVVLTLPGSDAVSAADLVAAITEQRPDAIEAIKGPAPEMALAHASDIVQLCAKAGVPALSATLLKDGVTKASAENTITMAGALKDTLAASGLSGSYDALVGCIDDPVKMVGKAIHEAKAEVDENGDQTRQITDEVKKTASLNANDIYAKRR